MFGKVPLDGNSLGIYPIHKLVMRGVSALLQYEKLTFKKGHEMRGLVESFNKFPAPTFLYRNSLTW
jgi:hypothetical protein